MVCAERFAEAQDGTVKRKILSADFADCTDFYVILIIKKLSLPTSQNDSKKKDCGPAYRQAGKPQ